MDNMLYIIAGLVLILLVAVVVLRKKKSPAQLPVQTGEKVATNVPTSTNNANRSNIDQRDPSSANKFDNLAIAQRFMDQQRYDTAIETLNRGLIERPNDNQLLFKLLTVYATLNQTDDFYRVYDTIKTHSDAATIAEADELKALVVEEQNQPLSSVVSADDNNSDDFGSLDFDLPTTQTTENSTSPAVAASSERVESFDDLNDISITNDSNTTDNNVDNTFELTLGDLEIDADKPVDMNLTPANPLEIDNEENLVTTDEPLIVPATNDLDIIENTEDDDFTLDFDLSDQATTPVDKTTGDSSLEEISPDTDNDFVLDFADLTSDTGTSTESNTVTDAPVKTTEDDFTLSLEDNDLSDAESQINAPAIIEESSYDEKTSITPTTTPPTFDDSTFIDDNFDFDFADTSSSPTATTPVEDVASGSEGGIESDTENANDSIDAETAADFASRFAADFDFVKTLDSNQVTLDLAGQYLKLGEYDSAKRLLNEVMTQGNDEQQSQAQALLERTA